MKSVILDGFAINPGDLTWDFLSEFGEYDVYDQSPEELVSERIGNAEIVVTNRLKINEEVLKKCPSLRFVSAFGTGYDMIDVAACRAHGVEVCNIPNYSTPSVAQFAFSLMLYLSTDITGFRAAVREGKWTGRPDFHYISLPFVELLGKTVGIYGCGAIGKRLAEYCQAFGMKVLAYRRSVAPGTVKDGISYVTQKELLSQSDFLSIHCPLTEETRGLVNEEFLSQMKPGAYLVNTSRGAVIDEQALYRALTNGQLKAAALDVMTKEPPARDNPLLTLDNCVITPHCAWTSKEARLRLTEILANNIRHFLNTGKGINRV